MHLSSTAPFGSPTPHVSRLAAAALASASIVAVGTAGAATIHVYPDGSGDAPTIAAPFLAAAPTDTILLGDGVFSEHDLNCRSRGHLISESEDPERTIIDAEFAGRCIILGFVTGAPSVRGITFRNGVDDVEGGLFRAGDVNARFSDCVAPSA